jgi:tRNA(fMet)-specific endonuclease VapC
VSPYLLDTNACILYLRQRDPGLIQRIKTHQPNEIRLCSVVVAELFFGAFRSPPKYRSTNLALLAQFLPLFVSLPFTDAAAEIFGRIRADVAARGVMLGPYDLQIAAIALAENLTLVTHNIREFGRVTGLRIEDWQTIP